MVSADTAVEVARSLGLEIGAPRVLHEGNNLSVHLEPTAVVARVCMNPVPHSTARHALEIEVVEYLMSHGVPVVPVTRALAPGPHACRPCSVTFWEFTPGEPADLLLVQETGPLLANLHAALAGYGGMLESGVWTAAIDAAGGLLRNPAALWQIGAADRALLSDNYDELRIELSRQKVRMRPIHGDVHPRNLLRSTRGYLWMDFESVCLGHRSGILRVCRRGPMRGYRRWTRASSTCYVGCVSCVW
jgi:Ser/Thr protein kinase RdoA (MazF antagonist)